MKNKNRIKIGLMAIVLSLCCICGSIPASAASNKVLVTDSDNDGTISVGDEFCLGAECFNVVENSDGGLRALAKYNLYVGANYTKVNLDISKTYVELLCHNEDETSCFRGVEYYFDGIGLAEGSMGRWENQIIQKYGNCPEGSLFSECFGSKPIFGDTFTVDGQIHRNMTYKLYPRDAINNNTEGYAKQNELALGVHGEKGNAVYPLYATVGFGPMAYTAKGYTEYLDGYTNFDFQDDRDVIGYLSDYKNILINSGYNVSDVDMPNIADIDNLFYSISGEKLPLGDWYDSATRDNGVDDVDNYNYTIIGDLKQRANGHSWIWNTSYWLKTAVGNPADFTYGTTGQMSERDFESKLYFISTAGDICYTDSCHDVVPRAGIRPLITMSASDFELNRLDINGTVRWIDNNNVSKIRPRKSVIKLYRNGAMIDSVEVEKDEDENLWRFSFINLLRYDRNGVEYAYSITQDDIAQYTSGITNFNVVNEYVPEAENPNTAAMNPVYYVGVISAICAGVASVVRRGRRG